MSDGRGRPPLPSGRSIPVIQLQAAVAPGSAPSDAMGTASTSGDSISPSIDGMDSAGVALGGSNVGATADTTTRRVATPMKRVASRVPVRDVTDQPLLSQAKQMLEDQRTK